jgi:hypothetical protein
MKYRRYFPPVDEIINSNVSTGGEGNVEIAAVSNDGSENHGDKNKDCGSRPEGESRISFPLPLEYKY